MEGEKRRGGRPLKDATDGRRPCVTFRWRPRMRDLIRAAAKANDHSVSEEIEKRLERSFANDEMRSIIREELAAAVPEMTGGPIRIDPGIEREALSAALRRLDETKIYG